MKKSITRVLVILVALALIPYLLIIINGLIEDKKTYDLAVVLGNKVNVDGVPSPRLAARLDRAYQIWLDKRCSAILVSGGTGVEGWDEAVVMKSYLESKGIPEGIIIVDSNGYDTWQTALKVKQVLSEIDGESAVAVSQFFHLSRCKISFKRAGIENVSSSYARFFETRDFYATFREVPAILKYWFFKARIKNC